MTSETPRTDALQFSIESPDEWIHLARTLERELALTKERDEARSCVDWKEVDRQNRRLIEQRDQLAAEKAALKTKLENRNERVMELGDMVVRVKAEKAALERERDELKQWKEEAEEAGSMRSVCRTIRERDAALAQLAEARREAVRLATSIWRAEYQAESPEWRPLETVAGVISQIDNMYAGVRQQRDEAKRQWQLACDAKQAELDRMKAERDLALERAGEYQSAVSGMWYMIAAAAGTISAIKQFGVVHTDIQSAASRAQIEKLRADERRLDCPSLYRMEQYHGAWHIELRDGTEGTGKTLREAIDAALAQDPKPL